MQAISIFLFIFLALAQTSTTLFVVSFAMQAIYLCCEITARRPLIEVKSTPDALRVQVGPLLQNREYKLSLSNKPIIDAFFRTLPIYL